jgi:hypothetical protein
MNFKEPSHAFNPSRRLGRRVFLITSSLATFGTIVSCAQTQQPSPEASKPESSPTVSPNPSKKVRIGYQKWLFRSDHAVLNGNIQGNKPLSLKLSKLLKP